MGEWDSWTDDELMTEYERCNNEAESWGIRATEAANAGGMGMAYSREYRERASKLWRRAARIAIELRRFRGYPDFARPSSNETE